MATRKYEDACGIARSLDVIGNRWALLVVRELLFGPKRFSDLRAGLRTISQNVLSQRLRDLEASGVVRRTLLGPPASTQAYELTARGRALEPVLVEMSRWGALTPVAPGAEMSNDAFALALEALFTPGPDGAFRGRVRLRLAPDAYDVEIVGDGIDIVRAAGNDPELVIDGTESVLRAVMFHDLSLDDAIDADELRIRGDRTRAAAFLRQFSLPDLREDDDAPPA
jgi:DNA-binding HxlR family transcriptional regulator